jgi:hypothetical protein
MDAFEHGREPDWDCAKVVNDFSIAAAGSHVGVAAAGGYAAARIAASELGMSNEV